MTALNKEKLSRYRDRALTILAGVCMMGVVSHLDEWLRYRKPIELRYGAYFMAAACACYLVSSQRIRTAVGALLIVAVIGSWGTITSQNFAAVPYILACALFAFLLIIWKGDYLK